MKAEDSAMVGARRVTSTYVKNKFKDNGAPLLEEDERGQFRDFLLDQEKQLNSYGWVDERQEWRISRSSKQWTDRSARIASVSAGLREWDRASAAKAPAKKAATK